MKGFLMIIFWEKGRDRRALQDLTNIGKCISTPLWSRILALGWN